MTERDGAGGGSLVIGLTGPIGCGKSTVAAWLAEEGARVVDADAVARQVTAPGTSGHAAVLAHFGPAVATADGVLDRAALGRIVFADPDRLRELEAIVHPLVRPAILARLEAAGATEAAAAAEAAEATGEPAAAGRPVIVIEAIKLVEGGLAELCDEVWLVTCDPATQRARLVGRGMAQDDAERRTVAQAGLADRITPQATRVLDTSADPETTRATVTAVLAAARAAVVSRSA